MSRLRGLAVLALAAAVAGCGNDAAPSSAPSTTTNAAYKLGESIAFKRKDNGQPVGVIRIMEVVSVPDECLFDPGHVIAVRAEIENPGDLFLPKPDVYGLKVIDRGGFTQDVSPVQVRSACGFPDIAPSQAHGKTTGWEAVRVREADPSALIYAPLVAEPDSTIEHMKFVTMSPPMVTLPLPNPLPSRGAPQTTSAPATTTPAPATTQATPPTTTRPVPAVGQACDSDSDTWAKSASGQQLRCAYAGGPSPKWVASAPFIGVRTPGSPCRMDAGVAESPDGQVLVCTGGEGPMTWQPGP